MMNWKPIDDATPKDVPILLWYSDRGAIEGWWFSSPKEIDDGWETCIGCIGDPSYWTELNAPKEEPDCDDYADRAELKARI